MQRPRVLVTGFTPFPGAPVNPTEHLIGALNPHPEWLEALGDVRLEVLPVDYAGVPGLLAALGRDFAPDIAVHFGLSVRAAGFTLERIARNTNASDRADNAGALPASRIFEGEADLPSTLPLAAIAAALARQGLPVSWSDDAGGYLCNFTFYLACSPHFAGYAPSMAGFVHVPPLIEAGVAHPHALSLEELVAGARTILETCARQWCEREAVAASAY